MNYRIIGKTLGIILMTEALLMIPSFLISIYHNQEDKYPFLFCILLTGAVGFILYKLKTEKKAIRIKEGLAIASFGWIALSIFGALPFVFSGSIPSYIDALFETISGFTTTGATLVNNVEALPKGILFWRSFTHWIGGMGILVFTVAFLPVVGGFQMFKAESPGPTADRFVPRIKDTAKILYITYIALTLMQMALLLLGGMSLFESAVHTFGTVGTGGLSTRSASIGAFNSTYIHMVIAVFMVLSGINFSLYYALLKRKWRDVLRDQELIFYLAIIFVSTLLIAFNLKSTLYRNFGLALKDAFFQVSSIITTTGYTTVDFDLWPSFSKALLFLLMFVGGCAGSTAGGVKVIRILVLFKLIKKEIKKIFHPRAIIPIRAGEDKVIHNDTITGITSFVALYFFIFMLSTVLISLEGIDLESTITAVAATLGNIGPGFGLVGPARSFSPFSPLSKILFSILMLLGRLELFTMVALFAPKSWRNEI
ncbi:TrkH family potassium uptake protein [Defluviitalea raffinosedens]|uniref:TrkH family potassium uptake protein n=1 Tax=Defluviitalea raffinosedens TaxID=1450156 RepID=UPI00195DDBF6|nr:TrkH family potassium uptake protein [Defluviitalea raffinosedens]MBM7684342.1 trk system potassium uptake protein TrkH [Defluviitalea raffinosedens]